MALNAAATRTCRISTALQGAVSDYLLPAAHGIPRIQRSSRSNFSTLYFAALFSGRTCGKAVRRREPTPFVL